MFLLFKLSKYECYWKVDNILENLLYALHILNTRRYDTCAGDRTIARTINLFENFFYQPN